jgi:hypothetical protein
MIRLPEGWVMCERGYVIKAGACIADADLPHGPVVEVSSLPSAGDGAVGGRSCPSGGCTAPPTIVVERGYRKRWNGPYPDFVYDHLQSRTWGRVVPIW